MDALFADEDVVSALEIDLGAGNLWKLADEFIVLKFKKLIRISNLHDISPKNRFF